MIDHMKVYAKTHLFYLVIGAVILIALRSWLQEHDARLVAESRVKESESRVSQIVAEKQAAIAVLQTKAKAVQTAPQAIAAIPEISSLDLHPRPLPELPTAVAVEAVPLYQALNACAQDRVERLACEKIVVEKDVQIKALKAKPKFWKRLGGELKRGTFYVSVGIVVAKVLL